MQEGMKLYCPNRKITHGFDTAWNVPDRTPRSTKRSSRSAPCRQA
jgi:hypothetical protein